MDRNMDLIVIGAGPAGLSAACAARACGLDVTLVDEQAAPGGQLFRNIETPMAQALLDPKAADYALVQHLAYEQDKIERLLDDPSLLRTPIVRNGRQATVGYCPDVWKTWE